MHIRKATIADAAAIAMLSAQLGYKISTEKTEKQIAAINSSDNDIAYVAVDDNKITGWIHVFHTLRLECASYCEIGGLVVDEHYRNKGTGKMLIEHVKHWCRDKNCELLKVRSNVKRKEAHIFYEHSGFAEIKQQKVFEIRL
jgi:GNAT superfamily N-acetyltransferase